MIVAFDPKWDAPDFDPGALSAEKRAEFDEFWAAELLITVLDADADAEGDV